MSSSFALRPIIRDYFLVFTKSYCRRRTRLDENADCNGLGAWRRLHRQWRKLHLAVDADTGEIAAHVLTEGHADDAAQVPALLGQAEVVIASITAGGVYDGETAITVAAPNTMI